MIDLPLLSMAGHFRGWNIAGLEEAECAFADVREFVGDDRVEALLGEAEFDEPTLSRLEIENL